MSLVQHSSKRDDWRSPLEVVELASRLLVQIELDPASDAEANFLIGASRFFSKDDNGLLKRWEAKTVWLNPPGKKLGGKSLAGLFWKKLVEHWLVGDVAEALFLGFSIDLLRVSQGNVYGERSCLDFPFCVPKSRLSFWHPEESRDAPPMGNVIVYLPTMKDTCKINKFKEIFGELGQVCIPEQWRQI